jgi:PIN domain nuclease of toxin-antitoxin system
MRAEPERLSEPTQQALRDPASDLYLSVASVWEIAIKFAAGRLQLPEPPAEFVAQRLEEDKVRVLSILLGHALRAGELPPHHRDPFDRLLVAQAQIEGLTLLTADRELAAYDVQLHWA